MDSFEPPAAPYRLRVALIHNHQPDRNAYLIPRLRSLCAKLDASLTMFGWQPPVTPHSTRQCLSRDWRYYTLQLAWSRYRRLGLKWWLNITRQYLFWTLPGYLDSTRLSKRRRISRIETLVTGKHIAAWQSFVESNATHLFCCEDDLVFKPDSEEQLRGAILKLYPQPQLRYVDVAGGLSVETLAIDRLVCASEEDYVVYYPAVTNTACGYMLSRDLAEEFLALLLDRPNLRFIGVDWMMNTMMMIMQARQIACDAVHFTPPIFAHGTFTGDYVSWMKTALADDGVRQ